MSSRHESDDMDDAESPGQTAHSITRILDAGEEEMFRSWREQGNIKVILAQN